MILHAVFLAPGRLSAATLLEMTSLWVNYAGITLCQALKTRVAVALVKTFARLTAAVHAKNITFVM
jgi:hypothetical protein